MNFASWSPPVSALGGFLGLLEAILVVLERPFVDSGSSWMVWAASQGGLGPIWGPRGRGDRPGGPRGTPWECPVAPARERRESAGPGL